MPRDSINDHPITCGESSSDFMFQLLSLTAGRASNGDLKVQRKSQTERFKKQM